MLYIRMTDVFVYFYQMWNQGRITVVALPVITLLEIPVQSNTAAVP